MMEARLDHLCQRLKQKDANTVEGVRSVCDRDAAAALALARILGFTSIVT